MVGKEGETVEDVGKREGIIKINKLRKDNKSYAFLLHITDIQTFYLKIISKNILLFRII